MNNNKNTQKQISRRKNYVFTRIRDPVLQDVTVTTPVFVPITTDGSGATSGSIIFAPLGVTVPVFTVSGGVFQGSYRAYDTAHCPWLWNQSRNYERYRVLNATLIFVANVGVTTLGSLAVSSSTDTADFTTTPITVAKSTGGKVISLANSGNREQRFPLDVDASWKKVSAATVQQVNTVSISLLPLNSINDITFTTVNYVVTGGPASVSVGSFFLEYDVEFRDPTSYAQNT